MSFVAGNGMGFARDGRDRLVSRASLSAQGQSITLSGLDGNRDGEYFVTARLLLRPAVASNVITMRPNGLTTNLDSDTRLDGAGATAGADWRLISGLSSSASVLHMMDVTIHLKAAKTLNGVSVYASYDARSTVYRDATDAVNQWDSLGFWEETSTNLTSLEIRSSDATGLEAGSEALVWAPDRTFGS